MATHRVTVSIKGMTCAGCVARIEQTLRQQEGVVWANINFAASQATVTYDPSAFDMKGLSQAIKELGYELRSDLPARMDSAAPARGRRDRSAQGWQPVVAGSLAAVALIALYLGLVSLAQGWQYATGLLWRDGWLAGAIALSFGLQVGLYVQMRRLSNLHHRGRCGAMTATGTGTSSAAMLACCAHHLTDILPILGLSAASVFLNRYRIPFALFGLGVNLAGIGLMLRLIRQTYSPGLEDVRRSGVEAMS